MLRAHLSPLALVRVLLVVGSEEKERRVASVVRVGWLGKSG